jgi:AcrR family transcriptional regulator
MEQVRRRRKGSEVVAEELLDAALVEFAAHGFEGTSTRAIAQRAGCHQPQINYHFASKEQLWQAAVDRLFGQLGEASPRRQPSRTRWPASWTGSGDSCVSPQPGPNCTGS